MCIDCLYVNFLDLWKNDKGNVGVFQYNHFEVIDFLHIK